MFHKLKIERQDGVPFIWGWDDESIYFVSDGTAIGEIGKRIQNYPVLHKQILELCERFFEKELTNV